MITHLKQWPIKYFVTSFSIHFLHSDTSVLEQMIHEWNWTRSFKCKMLLTLTKTDQHLDDFDDKKKVSLWKHKSLVTAQYMWWLLGCSFRSVHMDLAKVWQNCFNSSTFHSYHIRPADSEVSSLPITPYMNILCTFICESLHQGLFDLASSSTETRQWLFHTWQGFNVLTFVQKLQSQ